MTAASNLTTFSNTTLGSSNGTIFTADSHDGNVIRGLFATNADSSSHTVTLQLVRKGGALSDANAIVIAAAIAVPGGTTENLLAGEHLLSALDELQMEPGDTLQGSSSAASEVTLLVLGE